MALHAGMSGFPTVSPMVVGAILANAGISFDVDKIVDSIEKSRKFKPGHIQEIVRMIQ